MNILPDTDPLLRRVCAEVTPDTWPTKALLKEMHALRTAAKGAGLAAPQVGLLQRFVIVDPQYCPSLLLGCLINPRIVCSGPETCIDIEGCLSSGTRRERIERYKAVEVEFTTFGGYTVRRFFYKFASRLIQHEIDHLSGILFTDHLNGDLT